MSEKQELKPCPFCGKEVKQKWSNDGEFCSISCDGCGVDIGLYDNGTFLIEDWNNRKGEDALQSEIDRLNKDKTNLLSALEGMESKAIHTHEVLNLQNAINRTERINAELVEALEKIKKDAEFLNWCGESDQLELINICNQALAKARGQV